MSRITGIPPGKKGKAARKQGKSPGILFGVNNNDENGHSAEWVAAKVLGDRGGFVEFTYNEAEFIAHVEGGTNLSYSLGLTPSILIGVANAYLGGINANTYATACVNAITAVRGKNPGKPYYVFELINEPYNCGEKGSNAADYALICKAVYEKVEAAGIPLWPATGGVMLLCAAHLTYQLKTSEKVAGAFSDYTTGGGWMKDFITAWPGAATKVNGWTAHPYGFPKTEPTHEGNNNIRSAKLQRENAFAVGFGNCPGINNWWLTEFGYNIHAGEGIAFVPDAATQAAKLKEALEEVEEFRQEGWCKAAIVFADGTVEWGIDAKPAQKVLEEFAIKHGVAYP